MIRQKISEMFINTPESHSKLFINLVGKWLYLLFAEQWIPNGIYGKQKSVQI